MLKANMDIPQALLIVQIPNAQEIIIVLQENYPTQRVKVCSSRTIMISCALGICTINRAWGAHGPGAVGI
jgi:hypothetical protein